MFQHMERGDITNCQDVMKHARVLSANNFNVNENDCQLDLLKNLFYSLTWQRGRIAYLPGADCGLEDNVGGVCKGLLLDISLDGYRSRHAG